MSHHAMIAAARQAFHHAYAPYSNFPVGCALLDEHGHIHAGANVENAAYPQGQCAEASAIGALVTSGGRRITKAVICGQGPAMVPPCGGCRQRLREFATLDTIIHLITPDAEIAQFTLGELLPHDFGPSNLES